LAEWRSAVATFLVIFLAELGDKTQLMVMSLSAKSRAPHMILLGAAAGLFASSIVAVWAGTTFLKAIPLRTIRFATGVAFVGIGGMLVYRSVR